MKKIIILLMLLILSQDVFAASSNNTCLDINTSWQYNEWLVNGVMNNVSGNESCYPLGCNNITGKCNIPDPTSASLFGIALLMIAGLFIVAAIKSSAGIVFRGLSIEFLQPLFFTFAFLMILAAFSVMLTGAKSDATTYGIFQGSYMVTMWVFIFFISFLVLSFIINILTNRMRQATRGARK